MSRRVTIAIAGCGAVTERYYMPALRENMARVQVVGLFDSDPARTDAIASGLGGARTVGSFEALVDLHADLVILASPPAFHAEQAITAIEAGSHVLCEKPMALAAKDAEAMCAAAARHSRMLGVNMVRRHFPASRMVETLIRAESFGRLQSVCAFEGGPFRWPIRGQDYFSKAVSGGGVLADVGTHILDLLGIWLGEAELVRYEDDAMGGVEANARIELHYGDTAATIRLSRDWARPNRIELVFEKARVCWRAERLSEIEVRFNDAPDPLILSDQNAHDFRFVDSFVAQIRPILDHIEGRSAHIVAAEQVLPVVALIERAYAAKQPMAMPWLEPLSGGAHGRP